MPLDFPQYLLALFGTFCAGCSKAGLTGSEMINVLLQAELWGAKRSIGIVLVLLVIADLTVYPIYRRHGSWKGAIALLPAAMLGVVGGYLLLGRINDVVAARVIGGTILCMLGLLIARKRLENWFSQFTGHWGFAWVSGILLGFATMVANAAGPVIAVYFLLRQVPKMEYIGTAVRFFLFINLFKIPFNRHLELISRETLVIDLWLLPGLIAGIIAGRWIVQRISQQAFQWLLITSATLAALRLLLR